MNSNFIETTLVTEFGTFNIRVYSDVQGKETAVLYTQKLDTSIPPLVRIHSECITGDTFQSLQCDCGEQLEHSFKLINDDGNGVMIYLRQEGRGIGLFEKIRSYELQRKGHDTFEANILLGHKPDERTYEKAKMALDDLKIAHIRLITNSPSKVSEIEGLGIRVTERIPIVIAPNKYNTRYLGTKQDKFNHFLDDDPMISQS